MAKMAINHGQEVDMTTGMQLEDAYYSMVRGLCSKATHKLWRSQAVFFIP